MQKRKEIKVTQGEEKYFPQKEKIPPQKRLGYLEDSRLGSEALMAQEYTFFLMGRTAFPPS